MRSRCEDVISKGREVDDIVSCAADLINLFVQLNWTGPDPPVSLNEQLESLVGGGQGTAILTKLNKESLDRDGEVSYDIETQLQTLLAHS